MVESSVFFGVDVGSQSCMILREDAEIVRTSTGSLSRPTLVSFNGKERYVGEGALAYASGESTVTMLPVLLGRSADNVKASETFKHRKCAIDADDAGRLRAIVQYCDNEHKITATALLGMLLVECWQRVQQVAAETMEGPSGKPSLCFSVPPQCNKSVRRAYLEAAAIAGIPKEQIQLCDGVDCIIAAYNRKLDGLGPGERAQLAGKYVLLVDMGHMQSTSVVVRVIPKPPTGDALIDKENHVTVEKVAAKYDDALGAHHFDARIFDHLASKCPHPVVPGTKTGYRLLTACEKMRKLLSQLSEAQVTVERIAEDNDMNFTMKREELSAVTADLLDRFKSLLSSVLADAAATQTDAAVEKEPFLLTAVEILGGGVRMQVVQQLMHQAWADINGTDDVKQNPFGAKLDDGSVALGAALIGRKASDAASLESTESDTSQIDVDVSIGDAEDVGLQPEELNAAQKFELEMQARDSQIRRLMAERNALESYILEMRGAMHKKHGDKIDAVRLRTVLDEYENWMYDEGYDISDVAVIEEKNSALRTAVNEICTDFFAATEADRLATERELELEAARAAAEKAANGEEDEDHDTRKLRKPDRMRLVMKNKEEGTELFKGKNYRPAAARYQKALTHSAKFFDLSKEDEEEVREVKLSLYLNLASCYIKLENWEQVSRHCEEALKLDADNMKALFRRSAFFEHKKDWDSALKDIKQCQKLLGDKEDKLIAQAAERIKREIQKEKAREKKTWGKMFG